MSKNVQSGMKTKGEHVEKKLVAKRIWSSNDVEKEYEIHDQIGLGGGGAVYSATRRKDNKPVAIKRLRTSRIEEWGEIDGCKAPIEFEMLHRASQHPNVIEMVDWFQWKKEHLLVMERPDPVTDILKALEKDGLPEMIAQHVFRQVTEATLHCHKMGVIHRDIKGTNVLFNPHTLEAKLIDFGVSERLKNEPQTELAGTRQNFPPEWFVEQRYDGQQLDVWCLGTLLYIMVEGEAPFRDVRSIVNCEFQHEIGGRVSFLCKDLIEWILQRDPDERPTIEEILSHPWLSVGQNKECLLSYKVLI